MEHSAPLIDFHTHILPGADHGSSGTHETMNQMQMIQTYGVDTVVATPHFYPHLHSIEQFVPMAEDAVDKIRKAGLPFASRLCLGAEVLYCDHIDEMPDLDRLCIRGTNVLLLELPMDQISSEVFSTAEGLLKKYTVVLAHIDRYILDQSDAIRRLCDMGALAQINAYSLFSRKKRRKLEPYLESESVVALGSDLHGEDKKSYLKFVNADQKIGSLRDTIMMRTRELLASAENFLEG